jgi:hemerythrin-like domain-containing protein
MLGAEPVASAVAPITPDVDNPFSVGLQRYFTQDHRACDAMWAEVETAAQADDSDGATAAFDRFEAALLRHLDMEEQVIFPAFESATGMMGGGPTYVMRHEHTQMRAVLDQMRGALDDGDLEMLQDQGDTLMMLIQQHNMKEEGMLYPLSERHLQSAWDTITEKLSRF